MTQSQHAAVRAAVMVTLIVLGFALLHEQSQHLEAKAAAGLTDLVTWSHRVVGRQTSLEINPYTATPFRAVLTPSCSALASMLTVVALSFITVHYPWRRRLLGTAAAVFAIAVGNVVRISASVGAGMVAGRASTILFHDWVGGALTFVYTLLGFALMLFIVLPDRGAERMDALVGR